MGITTRSMTRDTAPSVKNEPGDMDSTSRSNQSTTMSVARSAVSFTGSTLTRMLGCLSVYILFLTTGTDRVVQGKCLASHLTSVSVGAIGCYSITMILFPSSLPTCVGENEKDLFHGYEIWTKRKEASSNSAGREKRQSVFQPSWSHFNKASLDNTTAASQERDLPTLAKASTALPATSPTPPASSHASLVPRNDSSDRYTDQEEEEEEEKEEEKEEDTTQSTATTGPAHQLTPTKAQLQDLDLEPNYFITTLKIPMKTIAKVTIGTILIGTILNCCGCLGVFCQAYQKERTSAPTSRPTFPAMNEETTSETRTQVTWEDTLALRGLGGLGRLTTPSPPPFPTHQDAIIV